MRIFFILSLGRAGTMTLSRLLGQAGGACVHHEPWPADRQNLFYRYAGGFDGVLDALMRQRFDALLPRDPAITHYGEANSYLRYETGWLRKALGAQTCFVVRDGRDFVRSSYARSVLTPSDLQQPVVPKDGDPAADAWTERSRFEQLCWYWTHTNEMLLRSHPQPLKMEDLLASYACFHQQLLCPLELDVDETTWRHVVSAPLNASAARDARNVARRFTRRVLGKDRSSAIEPLPAWREWPDELTERFWEICGDTMTRIGYRE